METDRSGLNNRDQTPVVGHNRGPNHRRLTIEYVTPEQIKAPSRQLRRHSRGKLEAVKQNLRIFRIRRPILVDGYRTIVDGQVLFQAMLELGEKEIPVIVIDDLSEAELRALRIALNRLGETSSWDGAVLGLEFFELSNLKLDFSLDATGFTLPEIDAFIDETLGDPEAEEALKIGPAAVTQLGDKWLLAGHQVVCGSSLDEKIYAQLCGSACARTVVADFPYNLKVKDLVGKGQIQHREFSMGSGEMSADEFAAFLSSAIKLLIAHSVNGSLHYLFMDFRHLYELLSVARRLYAEYINLAVWSKDIPGMGSFLRSQHELIPIFKAGSAKHKNNVQLGKYGRNRGNVWEYPSVGAFARKTEEGRLLELHPTAKPVKLVADAILDSSDAGEIVLDPFLGSGTTLVAAERTRRRCFGIEIDPLYVDTALRRWQAYSGDCARHAVTGRTFDETEDEAKAAHDA